MHTPLTLLMAHFMTCMACAAAIVGAGVWSGAGSLSATSVPSVGLAFAGGVVQGNVAPRGGSQLYSSSVAEVVVDGTLFLLSPGDSEVRGWEKRALASPLHACV